MVSVPRRSTFVLPTRWRRPLAALCAAGAVACTLLALRTPDADTVDVLVAARDLDATTPLSRGDAETLPLPEHAVPDGALAADADVAGRNLSAPVRRGEILTSARVGVLAAAEYGSGLVAAPVRIDDPAVSDLLAPGSRVDVLAADAEQWGPEGGRAPAEVVAEDRPVIAVPDAEPGSEGLLLVALSEQEAGIAAARTAGGHLSVTIREQ